MAWKVENPSSLLVEQAYALNSTRFSRGMIARVRAATVRRVDAFAIPGRISEETIRNHWHVTDKPFLPLPNLVDEKLFKERVILLRAISGVSMAWKKRNCSPRPPLRVP